MTRPIESRLPVALSVLVMVVLAVVLPDHHRPVPLWLSFVGGAICWLVMAGVTWGANEASWLRAEALVLKPVAVIAITEQVLSLGAVIGQILGNAAQPSGLTLLTSGVNVWL